MLRLEFTGCVIKLHVIESVYTRASKYFKSERLRRAFTFATMYLGMSPFDAPGTYSLLQYTELAEGVWYPRGGFHGIPNAIVNIGKRMGVEYRLSTPVKSVALTPDQKRATGVILEDGSKLESDIVVVNADLVHSYNNLFPVTEQAKKLAKKPMSCSAISFYWSLNTKVTKLDTHNVFLANEYKESFDAIFQRQDLPNEISFYANVPSRIDPAAAPEGCDAVVILVPCGNLSGTEKNWPEIVQRVKAGVLKVVKARIGVDLGDKIVDEVVSTPHDWQQKFNLHQGAILGLAHDFFNVLCFRPKTKHPTIEACYFVGASTHPGKIS
jgi:phytoene desaturase (3,4-didehydrolycopene-forming)